MFSEVEVGHCGGVGEGEEGEGEEADCACAVAWVVLESVFCVELEAMEWFEHARHYSQIK